jgi:drug/metabolite transporter (DMT)-like permease
MEDKSLRWLLLTAIAPIAWGSTYFVTRQFLPADAPLWGALFRALPAGLILLLISRRLPHGVWWWRAAVLGILNVGGFFVLVYVAGQRLPSSVAATVMSASAAAMMLLAWMLRRQRPRVLAAIGAGIGLVGVALLVGVGGEPVDGWGLGAAFAGMLSSSLGFVLTGRWGNEIPGLTMASWQLTMGGLMLLPVAFIVDGPPPTLTPTSLVGFAYLSLVSTALAFTVWFAGLRRLPAATVGLVGLLNPVTGVALGVFLAGEPFGLAQVVGLALVLTGIVLGAVTPRWAHPREGMAPREGADAASVLPSDQILPSMRVKVPVQVDAPAGLRAAVPSPASSDSAPSTPESATASPHPRS